MTPLFSPGESLLKKYFPRPMGENKRKEKLDAYF